MKLVQLIYFSANCIPVESTSSDLVDIVDKAKIANKRHGISGLLLFSGEYYLQVLEGPRAAVNNLYRIIQKDSRHKDPQILRYQEIDQREFNDWTMTLASYSRAKENIYFKYCGGQELAPTDLTGEGARQLLLEFRNLLRQS